MAIKRNSKLLSYLSVQYPDFSLTDPAPRLNSLYSDFSKLRTLNRYAYDANKRYWRSVILDCNAHGCLGSGDYNLVVDRSIMAEQFLRPITGKPLALDCVLEGMVEKGELIPLEDFMRTFASQTWLSWTYETFVKGSLYWIGRTGPSNLLVVIPTIRQITKHIQQSHYHTPVKSACDHILTLSEFKTLYGQYNNVTLTDEDMELVLTYMSSQMGVAVADNVRGYGTTYTMIKFPENNNNVSSGAVISQHDKAIITIRTTCQALHAQVNELQRKIEELSELSKYHHKLKHTAQALYALKRRKYLESILEKRLQSLETMDNMLMSIEASQNDLQIVQAFNTGASALRAILRDSDLTVDSVDEVMTKLQSAFEDQKEVEDAIAMGSEETMNSQLPGLDMDELQRELDSYAESETSLLPEKSTPPPRAASMAPGEHPSLSVPISPPAPSTSPPIMDSELARLNQVLSSIKTPPKDTRTKHQEYAV
ncbi:Snf7-domain-containing protein [Radiomyces spectabilis]|uniref:Snf7-domain-containing protein n=1 Tax=Radiomyces spectabilis TaxID=64574 RepID=UPI0022209010|nr:Snf7-domain-containing protein [Radiomyces spectabilis]KAI8388382.1 Snf7-domain-containing protein [Radiomyces spectabilis]